MVFKVEGEKFTQLTLEDRDPRAAGVVVVDGSCFPHLIKEFSRAAWAMTFLDAGKSGSSSISVRGPVWSSLPQTEQAAEKR